MIALGAAVPVIAAAGAYLKWAVRPVTLAYRAGRTIGRRAGGDRH